MTEPRFAVGDLVRMRPATGGTSKAVWRVERRDYWRTDTEPAYELRYGIGKHMHVRFAMQSDLELVETNGAVNEVSGGSPADSVNGIRR